MTHTAQVAVNDATIHFDKLYTYLIPPELAGSVWPGSMVLVPFGRGDHPRMAVVLAVGEEETPDPRCKSLLDAAPEDARLDRLEPGAEGAFLQKLHQLQQVRRQAEIGRAHV